MDYAPTIQPTGSFVLGGIAQNGVVILGSFSASHLGDLLCTSPLPRLLTQHYKVKVVVTVQPNTRNVFTNNPYVLGFTRAATIMPGSSAAGNGHVIQRLMQGFEMPFGRIPKPEIYLDAKEKNWAHKERKSWPADRPVCLVACGALTDREKTGQVDWLRLVSILSKRYTVIQSVFAEPSVPGAICYQGLSVRKFMSLFSVSDCFVGGTSGGSHVAAAFNVPSLVVIWKAMEEILRFPVPASLSKLPDLDFKASFLYPQHWFMCAEDLGGVRFRHDKLDRILEEIAANGCDGRRSSIGNHPRWPCGFSPQSPPRVTETSCGRFVRVPHVYGEV